VAHCDKALASFFVVGLDAAVFANNTAPTDEGDAQVSLRQLVRGKCLPFFC
jgi:hypothetical protein